MKLQLSRREFVAQLPALALLISGLPGCSQAPAPPPVPRAKPEDPSLAALMRFVQEKGDSFELSNNENPLGPSPLALAAVAESAKYRFHHRYSSHIHLHNGLKEKVAASLQLEKEFFDLLPGTMDILLRFIEELSSPKRALVVMKPDYYMMAGYARHLGHKVREIDVGLGGEIDAAKFLAFKNEAGFLYFSNPNNPLGTFNQREKILELVKAMPEVPVVVDEAYIHYLDGDYEARSLIRHVREYKNLIVLRTYSKIYGLAGLRAGLVASHPEARKRWKLKTAATWSLSSQTMVAVFAALDDKKHTDTARAHNDKMRRKVLDFAAAHKLQVSSTQGLSAHISVPGGKETLEKLRKQGIWFNEFVTPLPFVRLTMGSEQGLDKFLAALN